MIETRLDRPDRRAIVATQEMGVAIVMGIMGLAGLLFVQKMGLFFSIGGVALALIAIGCFWPLIHELRKRRRATRR